MNIDLSKLIINNEDEIALDEEIIVPEELLKQSNIRRLENVRFVGTISKLIDDTFQINGNLSGTMILPDDITLEDTKYDFSSEIDENINEFDEESESNWEIINNSLDILEFLWQNILVEIPLKVVNEKNKDLTLKGEGWRLVGEEDHLVDNNPFSELGDMINSRKELK